MDIKELKAKIKEYGDFREILSEEGYGSEEFEKFIGLSFKFIKAGRSNSDYFWTWQIGDKMYQLAGSYDSWAASEMDDIMDFYEVREVEKVIKVYERVE